MKLMQEENAFTNMRCRMVEEQIVARGIKNPRVLTAFNDIPRHEFVYADQKNDAYADYPLPIGYGQTISQPYIVALMTELLDLEGHEKVLEIGTGSGYQAAILSRLAGEVHSVERIEKLAVIAEKHLEKLEIGNVSIHVGDGSRGWPKAAPYDRILVTAASPEVPKDLLDQLKPNGKLVIPLGPRWRQMLEVWENPPDKVVKKEILPVMFVPLKGEFGWQDADW